MNKETRFSKVFLITVIAIGIIFYIYFLRTGKKPAPAPAPAPSDIGEEKLPLISMSTSLEKPTSVEEYGMMTEYYTDSDLVDLSTKVKIKLTLNIDKAYLITKITITRSVGVEKRDTKVITNQDFKKGDNIIFFESKQGENMIATHKFSVTYTSALNSVDIGGPTTEVTINYDDISLLETFDSDTYEATYTPPPYVQMRMRNNYTNPTFYVDRYNFDPTNDPLTIYYRHTIENVFQVGNVAQTYYNNITTLSQFHALGGVTQVNNVTSDWSQSMGVSSTSYANRTQQMTWFFIVHSSRSVAYRIAIWYYTSTSDQDAKWVNGRTDTHTNMHEIDL